MSKVDASKSMQHSFGAGTKAMKEIHIFDGRNAYKMIWIGNLKPWYYYNK